jgi:hypothetical protein
MKSCAYCGKENDDTAVACGECGTSEFKGDPTVEKGPPPVAASESPSRWRDLLSDPARRFKAVVIVATVANLLWFFQFRLWGRLISRGTYEALSWEGYGALLRLPPSIAWLSMLLTVAVAIGLCTFSRSARLVFTLLTAFFTVMFLLLGVQVDTAFGSFLSFIATMADGAILVMAYTPPLQNRFQ